MPMFDKFPLASPGWPYLSGAAFLACTATALDVWWMAAPLWLALGFIAYFFRDPARRSRAADNEIISPADGKVVAVREVDEPRLPGGRARLVSVFMNVFDVHVNRAPIGGKVVGLDYIRGRFVPADRAEASRGNERLEMLLEDPAGRLLLVTQVAGLVARRIECRLSPGDVVSKGERYGMIRFGSRLDVYLPLEARARVAPGQRVKAGVSVIGEM